MPYQVEFKKSAYKTFASLSVHDRRRIGRAIEALKNDPFPEGNVKKLHDGVYRIRVGNFRIVYDVINEKLMIYVLAIGDRKEIYKLLKRL